MSLDWNAEKVADLERKRAENPKMLDCLIWASMGIGMGEITEKNYKEWVYRLRRSAFEGRPLIVHPDGIPYEITEDLIKPWIGLWTNVKNITNAEFDAIMRKRTKR